MILFVLLCKLLNYITMKTKFLKFTGSLFAFLLVQSCQKDELPQNAENYNSLNKNRPTGYIPSTPEELAQIKTLNLSSFTKKEVLPSKFSLPELPVALNQGAKGSCVAYSIAHARTILNSESKILADGTPNYEAYASGDYLFEKYKTYLNSCNGITFINGLDALKTEGTPSYADMGLVLCGTLPTPEQEKKASKNRINDYYRLQSNNDKPELEEIKRQIANGNPVLIGIPIDQDFSSSNLRLWDLNNSNNIDQHAVVLTGYDDEKQAFRLLNSWGSNWGNNGYIWATYRKIEKVITSDTYILEKDNPLSYKNASSAFVYLTKNINNPADNIDFLSNQMPSFINNGELNWNNNLAKPYYDQYDNPVLSLSYFTPANEAIDVTGDLTFEIRLKITSKKGSSYPANIEKGIELELWNGAYGGKNQTITCNIPVEGNTKESIFKNDLGEIYKYVAYTYLTPPTVNNIFERYKTIRFTIKNGQFYFNNSSNRFPTGINRLRTFYIKNIGTLGAITDVRVYKNGKQIGIDTFDGTIPWLQWFE